MKYFKIVDSKGFYWDGSSYQEIDKINKKDILNLLNFAGQDDFELDTYDASLIANKAHQIIYENISGKLEQFLGDKDQFKKDVEELYKEAMNKYSAEVKDEIEEEEEEVRESDDLDF